MNFLLNLGLGLLLALYAALLANLLRLQDNPSSWMLRTLSRMYNVNQMPRFYTRWGLEMLWVLVLYDILASSFGNVYVLYLIIILIRFTIIAGADIALKFQKQ